MGDRVSGEAEMACHYAKFGSVTEGEGFEPSSELNAPKRFSRPLYHILSRDQSWLCGAECDAGPVPGTVRGNGWGNEIVVKL